MIFYFCMSCNYYRCLDAAGNQQHEDMLYLRNAMRRLPHNLTANMSQANIVRFFAVSRFLAASACRIGTGKPRTLSRNRDVREQLDTMFGRQLPQCATNQQRSKGRPRIHKPTGTAQPFNPPRRKVQPKSRKPRARPGRSLTPTEQLPPNVGGPLQNLVLPIWQGRAGPYDHGVMRNTCPLDCFLASIIVHMRQRPNTQAQFANINDAFASDARQLVVDLFALAVSVQEVGDAHEMQQRMLTFYTTHQVVSTYTISDNQAYFKIYHCIVYMFSVFFRLWTKSLCVKPAPKNSKEKAKTVGNHCRDPRRRCYEQLLLANSLSRCARTALAHRSDASVRLCNHFAWSKSLVSALWTSTLASQQALQH